MMAGKQGKLRTRWGMILPALALALAAGKANAAPVAYIDAPSVMGSGLNYTVRVGLNDDGLTRAFQWKLDAWNDSGQDLNLISYGFPSENDFFYGHSMEPGYNYVSGLNSLSVRMTALGDPVVNGNGFVGEYVFNVTGNPGEIGHLASYAMDVTRPSGSQIHLADVYQYFTIAIPGDANRDGIVDTTDLTRLATDYGHGNTWEQGDFNGDGVTDTTDLTILATYFGYGSGRDVIGSGGGTGDSIPEPATLSLLALGACGLSALGKRRGSRQ